MGIKSDTIQQQAQEIANKVGQAKVGMIPILPILIPVITAFLPKLIEMFQGCTNNNPLASTPQKFVQHRYDDTTEIYDSKLLKLTRDEVRKEAKKQGQKISKDDAELIAIKTLDQTRLAENKVIGACFRK